MVRAIVAKTAPFLHVSPKRIRQCISHFDEVKIIATEPDDVTQWLWCLYDDTSHR
jgi:hypothetical protein